MLILIAFLLALTACAPATLSPEPTQVVTSLPGGTATCVCPTGAPATAAPGSASPYAIVCHCPAILVSPPVTSGTEVPATVIISPPFIPPDGGPSGGISPLNDVTLDDNGQTFTMEVGDTFLLKLGMDIYNWSVEIDNQDVLSREPNVMVVRGAQGIYRANAPGTAVLTAAGDPQCRQSTPACMLPSMLFRITVIVQ